VIIVADSSPLIILAKLGCFDLLRELFPVLHISVEVHHELVIAGAGLPGSSEVAAAPWITVTKLRYPTRLLAVRERYAMGAGELSTILSEGSFALTPCCSMTTRRANWPEQKDCKCAELSAFSKTFIVPATSTTFVPRFANSWPITSISISAS
jgi:hypothetical protein